MRSRKALLNILSSFTLQIVTIICGFIAPRLIIETFGSGVNGVIASISQFLGYIVLLEAGVGGVVRAALYKPLAKKDNTVISGVVKATEQFFRILAFLFVGYSLIIALLFPYLVDSLFEYFFTFTLVLIIGASTFIQYYFGVTYQIVLQADQKGYITSNVQILTTIINTLLVIVLIKLGTNIHMVKLGSTVIYIIRPILLNIYVMKKYKINKKCSADNNAIKQRWDGVGHHIAFFLHTNTDIVVLTLLTNVKEVSVYSVYLMIVSGIEKLTTTFSTGLEAAFGNMIALNEKDELDKNFRIYEFMSYTITTILFTTTSLIILPFVSVYTKGITDANYYRPLFAYILTAAEAIYCIRLPYHAVVLAAGHFKQTRNGAFMEAFINIFLSFILVNYWGIVGVAFGTLCAMLFRTIQYAMYLSKHILERSIWIFVKRFAISMITVFIIVLIVNLLPMITVDSYVTWMLQAMIVGCIAFVVTFTINLIFYFENLKGLLMIFRNLMPKPKSNESVNKIKLVDKSQVDKSQVDKSQVDKSQIDESQIDESQIDESQIDESQVNESQIDESQVNESQVNESQVNESQVNEGQVNESQVNESQVNESQLNDNQINESQVNESRLNDSHINESQVNESRLNESRVNENQVKENQVNEKQVNESQINEG